MNNKFDLETRERLEKMILSGRAYCEYRKKIISLDMFYNKACFNYSGDQTFCPYFKQEAKKQEDGE